MVESSISDWVRLYDEYLESSFCMAQLTNNSDSLVYPTVGSKMSRKHEKGRFPQLFEKGVEI
jgi:hypothetical protein